jgi:hypothetical protein
MKMENENKKLYVDFEVGNLTKSLSIIILSFVSSALVGLVIKHFLKNSLGVVIFIAIVTIISVFFVMQAARTHVRAYFEVYGWLVIPPALAAIFMISSLKPLAFFVLFLIHALAAIFLRALKNNARIGIEFVLLITVLGSFVYGPKVGALLGPVAMLMDYALSTRLSYFAPVTITSYALIGFLAGSFAHLGIATVGIAAAVGYNIVTAFIILVFMGGNLDKCLRFGFSNVAINAVLFMTVAPFMLSILS